MTAGDARLRSPAFARNAGPIIAALGPLLDGAEGAALEIGCGPGEHALALARAFPSLTWRPTDPDPEAVASTAAWRAAEGPANLLPPMRLDARDDWSAAAPPGSQRLVLAVNVTHISPWGATEALVAGAARALEAGGLLATYGPFLENETPTAPSNRDFDRSLKARDPSWGLRRREDVDALALAAGLGPPRIARLPANNLLVAWAKPGA